MGKYKNRNRHLFLLTLFPKEDKYSTLKKNGFVLVKYFSNTTHEWEVAIYTPSSYQERQNYLNKVPVGQVSDSQQTAMV